LLKVGVYMERYIERNGKKLKYGYTTGSCAAAASKAAVMALFKHKQMDYMTIDTPKGWAIDIEVNHIYQGKNQVTCSVIKDAGDDPDVTHGIEVFATATRKETGGICIEGGIGIGRITKKGLQIGIGEAAINPVPRQMIREEVGKVLPASESVDLLIFVPAGEEVAKKTFNAKLGIYGGISILGTSGIVEPMSEDAFKDALKVEMQVQVASGMKEIIFSFGNFGRDYILKRGVGGERILKTSNFVQHMLISAVELGIKKVLYIGHAGKMVKVSAGMGNTHSKYGDHRMTAILSAAHQHFLTKEEEDRLLASNTTDEAVEILTEWGIVESVFDEVAKRCKLICENFAHNQLEVECIIFSTINGTLASTSQAEKWMEGMKR